ncbi:MAG: hypothetical protein KAI73_11530 [Rhodospirillaceae bacterium]|nr:hypothetical protein [Rhodospirillaceae bacterium]
MNREPFIACRLTPIPPNKCMNKKILITGKGSAGSWQCRGVQLGGQVGRVVPKATLSDCKKADIIVVVKRLHPSWFAAVRKSGKPWIWDLIDFYPQPTCSKWSRGFAIGWVRKQINNARPDAIIYPNKQMQYDVGIDGTVIYHHSRQDVGVNPIRERVRYVGYEGSPKYLGRWRQVLEDECTKRGWEFRDDLPIDQVDIVVALRDDSYNGYCQRHWNSNVKLANAHGAGTPFIGQAESGYTETQAAGEVWVRGFRDIARAFDTLTPYAKRKAIHIYFLAHAISLESIGKQLNGYIEEIEGKQSTPGA